MFDRASNGHISTAAGGRFGKSEPHPAAAPQNPDGFSLKFFQFTLVRKPRDALVLGFEIRHAIAGHSPLPSLPFSAGQRPPFRQPPSDTSTRSHSSRSVSENVFLSPGSSHRCKSSYFESSHAAGKRRITASSCAAPKALKMVFYDDSCSSPFFDTRGASECFFHPARKASPISRRSQSGSSTWQAVTYCSVQNFSSAGGLSRQMRRSLSRRFEHLDNTRLDEIAGFYDYLLLLPPQHTGCGPHGRILRTGEDF